MRMSFAERNGGWPPLFMWVVALTFVSPLVSWWLALVLGVVVLAWPLKPEGGIE